MKGKQLLAAACLLLPLISAGQTHGDIKIPKIVATVKLPSPPTNSPDVGPFTTGESKPILVSDEDKKKLQDLAEAYAKVAEDNYPLIVRTLQDEAWPMHPEVHIVITYGYNGVAATSGSGFGGRPTTPTIEVSARYALSHPSDLGMIVHEMTHVVQSYPTYNPAWLVEGIADYVRWFNYEPVDKRPHPNPSKATARDSYQTTAAFLYWATNKYDKNLVPELNAAFQANKYSEDLFRKLTGKSLDELNTEWVASLGK